MAASGPDVRACTRWWEASVSLLRVEFRFIDALTAGCHGVEASLSVDGRVTDGDRDRYRG